jgi:hypothetical protein
MRIAVGIAAAGLAVSACGSQAGTGATATTSTVPPSSTSLTSPAAPWVRITDPSGVTFMFPSRTQPSVSTTSGGTTRTYLAKVGTDAVASIVVIPTPVALNVQNFFVRYPLQLKAQGYTGIKADAVTSITVHGVKGFQTAVRYVSPAAAGVSGPSYVFEQRAAIQLAKYFVVISAVAGNSHALTSADIAQAKATAAQLIAGFTPTAK